LNNPLPVPAKHDSHIEHKARVELQPEFQEVDKLALDKIMSTHIRRVLEMTGGRVGGERGAAHLLQINPSTLRKRMRKLDIPFGRKAGKV
jgi:transcriptional regulator with GAF, ATPase, and Fis domain